MFITPTQAAILRHPGVGAFHDPTDGEFDKPLVIFRPGDEVLTFVSRNLEPYRGYHIFMRALPEVLRVRPNAHVIIVGGQDDFATSKDATAFLQSFEITK